MMIFVSLIQESLKDRSFLEYLVQFGRSEAKTL